MRTLKRILKIIGGVLLAVAVIFFAGVAWPVKEPIPNERPAALVVENVNLVDTRAGTILPGADIIIEGDNILGIGGASIDPYYPADYESIDGTGLYAIPGLFDMHVHNIKLSPALTHPLFVANGVTAVRDMGGCLAEDDPWMACADDKFAWNQAVSDGQIVGPRFDHVTGLAIDGGHAIPDNEPSELGAPDPAGARARVELATSKGIHYLKPYSRLPKDSFLAMSEAAAEAGLYLAGHKPLAVSGHEAVAAGQRSIEHAFLFIWECYPDIDAVRDSGPSAVYTTDMRRKMIDEHDAGMCADLHAAMVDAGTAFTPTHTTRKLDAYSTDEDYRADARLRYIPGPLRTLWLGDADGMARRAGDDGIDSYRDFYAFGIRQTGVAHDAGVTILAGTDAPDSFAFPGSGLHDELEHLVQAGLAPLDALRAATIEPAKFLGLEGMAGVIEPGARADVVLLAANPLDDIAAVRDIDTVILAGTAYGRDDLDTLLADVESLAGSWTMWPKFVWGVIRSPIMMKQFAD